MKQCKHSPCCCNRVLTGTAVQPWAVPAPAGAPPMCSLPNIWDLCWLTSALCLIKIKSLLEWLWSAFSKERLVKMQDYLQTHRNKIFLYCHKVSYGRNMCKQHFYLPMFWPALKLSLLPDTSLAVLSHSCCDNKALPQPWGSASPLQPPQLSFNCWQNWWMPPLCTLPSPDHASPHKVLPGIRGSCRAPVPNPATSSKHICVLQVDVFEWCLRSYCIHFNTLPFFCWHLKMWIDVAWLSWTSLHGCQIPKGGDIWAQFSVDSRCHKSPLFFWKLHTLLTLHILAFHRNSPHAHLNCSLPDQIKSNNQLMPKCDYCPWAAGNREHSIKRRSRPGLIKLDKNYLWKEVYWKQRLHDRVEQPFQSSKPLSYILSSWYQAL